MALTVNTNLNAYTALNSLQNNQGNLQTSISRLSSGMRIVTAADDPAGLIISQKYAAQTGGLGQAISNAKDGINMVQTTEGALSQVSNILLNMRNLALHAANTGANDSSANAADQQQIKAALAQIDRIAQTTQFSSKTMLNGSAGTTGSASNPSVTFIGGSEKTVSGTYSVNVTQVAAQGKVLSQSALTTSVVTGAAAASTTGATTAAASTLTFGGASAGGGLTVNIASGSSVTDTINQVNQDAGAQAAGITASLSGGNVVFTSSHIGGSTDLTVQAGGDASLSTVTGVSGTTASNTGSTGTASGASLMNAETLTFGNGSNTTNINIVSGTSVAAAVSQINQGLKNAGITMTAAFDSSTQKFTLTNNDYGSGSTVKNTFSSNATGTASTGLASATGTTYNVASSGLLGSTSGADVQGTFTNSAGVSFAATGAGQFLTGAGGTDVDSLKLAVKSTSTGSAGTVTVANNSLQFQVGAFADQTVGLNIGSVSTNSLGTTATGTTQMSQVNLASIDVTTNNGAGAQDALKVIDAAISQVSSQRASLGAFQDDVLQSSVNNLTTAQQNIRASQSNIQDANFASEMLNYSRGQILNQTSMSMLTQANQNAQQVLKLFG